MRALQREREDFVIQQTEIHRMEWEIKHNQEFYVKKPSQNSNV